MIAVDMIVSWAWLAAVLFPAFYARNRPWLASLPARSSFLFSLMVAVVMTLAFLRIVLLIDLPEWTRIAVYGLIAVGATMQLAVLVRTQRLSRKG